MSAESPRIVEHPPTPAVRWQWIVVAAFVSFVLKLLFATQRGFWLDEYYTLGAVQLDLRSMVVERLEAGHSPLPFLYAKVFHDLLGDSEFALKLSSAFAAAAAVLGLGALARALRLRGVEVPLLVIAAAQPYWQEIGTEFRYMMPLVALGVFASAALVRWTSESRWRDGVAAAGFATLMLWWHGSAQFIALSLVAFVVLQELWSGQQEGRERRLAGGLAPLLAAIALSVPLLLLINSMKLEHHGGSPGMPSLRLAMANQVHTVFGEDKALKGLLGPVGGVFGVLAVGLYAVALITVARGLPRRNGDERRAAAFLWGVIPVLPLGILAYTGLVSAVQGPERYVAFLSVPGVLVLALCWRLTAGWQALFRNLWRGGLVFTYAVLLTANSLDQGDWQRECSQWMAAERRPDEPVITVGRYVNQLALRYHGMPWEGRIAGSNSGERDTTALEAEIRSSMADAGSGWLFLYRPGRSKIDDMLDQLVDEGFLVGYRRRFFSREMSLVALARTPAGLARLGALDEIRGPWISGSPIRQQHAKAYGRVAEN